MDCTCIGSSGYIKDDENRDLKSLEEIVFSKKVSFTYLLRSFALFVILAKILSLALILI
jgi:hypothetical protein